MRAAFQACLTLLLVAVSTSLLAACAASGMPFHGGDKLAEPAPSLSDVRVLHEELRLDMRPVERKRDAMLHARYQLQNDGEPRVLNLFFSTHRVADVRLRHQGKRLTGRTETRRLAALGKQERFAGESALGSSFDVPLQTGVQWLDVEYPIEPHLIATGMVDGKLLDYDMAPAQRWKEHAGISVVVQLPAGFEVLDLPSALSASTGPNTFTGHFDPRAELVTHRRVTSPEHDDRLEHSAATLRLHVAPPAGLYYWQSVAQFVSWALALLVPLYAALRLARIARRTRTRPTLVMRLRSLLTCLLFVVLVPFLLVVPLANWLPHRTNSFLPGVGMLASWLLGGLVCLLGHALVGRRIEA